MPFSRIARQWSKAGLSQLAKHMAPERPAREVTTVPWSPARIGPAEIGETRANVACSAGSGSCRDALPSGYPAASWLIRLLLTGAA